MARTNKRPLPAWVALWRSHPLPPRVLSLLQPLKLLLWRALPPLSRRSRQGRFPRSRPRLILLCQCLRTVHFLWRTSLLLLPRRSHTRSSWQELDMTWLPFPRSLALQSLPVRRWRRRQPDLASPCPSQGSRTLPGLSSPRPQTSGSGCLFPPPVTWLLHRPGCGPDGAPPSPRLWSVLPSLLRCRLPPLALVDLQDVSQDLPPRDLSPSLHLRCLLLIQKRPLLPAGSKRAGSSVRRRSRSSERSSTDRHRARVRRPQASPDSSSPTRRMSPPAKRSRWDLREVSNDSSSSEGRQCSSRPRRPWRSRSPLPHRRGSSPSPSPHHRYRNSPAPSRCPFGANMIRRPAGRPSLSPRRRSPSSHRRSRRPSRGRQSSPPSRSRGPHHRTTLSSTRSPSPQRHRNYSTSPRRHGSRSSSPQHVSHPYASDIRLVRLHADDDDQRPASTHPRDSPDPEQSPPVDGSQLSAEKVQKLFADLIAPPALSHYADPIPDSAPNNQLVPYVRTSASTAPTVHNSEPLETHGLFQNYQSFHRLSGDTEKEACTAAYHDLTNLMLSQMEEPLLINVSSSCPKTDDPFPCGLTKSNEMKQKHEKLHLQWPPQSDHHKVINHTLALYQHGPPPKSGRADKWPPPPVQNPWDKSFVPKDFPTSHKIPSTMPKRWDLHASSPLMLRPPQSTAVPEVPDSDISKISSWLEAFAARSAHTSTMSSTSMVGVYNFQQKVLIIRHSSVIQPPRTISRMTFR